MTRVEVFSWLQNYLPKEGNPAERLHRLALHLIGLWPAVKIEDIRLDNKPLQPISAGSCIVKFEYQEWYFYLQSYGDKQIRCYSHAVFSHPDGIKVEHEQQDFV